MYLGVQREAESQRRGEHHGVVADQAGVGQAWL